MNDQNTKVQPVAQLLAKIGLTQDEVIITLSWTSIAQAIVETASDEQLAALEVMSSEDLHALLTALVEEISELIGLNINGWTQAALELEEGDAC